MKNEELREIPVKNYIILGVVILVTVLLLYYSYMWVEAYRENKLTMHILDKYMEVINYNELDDYLVENPDTIVYVTVLENSEIRDFERNFKSVLKSKKINRSLLYLDITEELKDEEIKNEMDKKYNIDSVSIINVPVILVFDNTKLVEIYDIKTNDYDVKNLKSFINNIKFSSEEELDG